jgi:tripartite-type tricarboxylate transporter receptor subunit TctC
LPLEAVTWLGMHAPAGLPPAAIEKISAAISIAARKTEVQERFTKLGLDLAATGPQQFARFLESERARWEPVIRASGFKED